MNLTRIQMYVSISNYEGGIFMLNNMKEKIHDFLINKKNKLESKEHKITLKFHKFLLFCLGVCILNSMSAILGAICSIWFGIHVLRNFVLPLIKNIELKVINGILNFKLKGNFLNKAKEVKTKIKTLLNSKDKKSKLKKDSSKNKMNNIVKNTTKKINNFKVACAEKFKKKMHVKRKNPGTKIINSSYNLTKNNIIQDNIYVSQIQRINYSYKTNTEKVKTKTK